MTPPAIDGDSELHASATPQLLTVSVIIPTWNEAAVIASCLRSLQGEGAREIIVADGGSMDCTAALARSEGAIVVEALLGRSRQQNAGANLAEGEIFLFLHADCRLAPGAILHLAQFATRNPRVRAGCFRMEVADRGWGYRLVDMAAHLRAGVLGIPYGDQGIFVRRGVFRELGGFLDVRLMEDVLISLRLRSRSRIAVLSPKIAVSPRRWRQNGLLRQTLRNWGLTVLALMGCPPDRLARFYPAVR